MTPDEIDCCLRDFWSQHNVAPALIVIGAGIYDVIAHHFVFNKVTLEVYFAGVKVMRDPLLKWIAVSS